MTIMQHFHLSLLIFVRYYWIESSEDLQCIINKQQQQWEVFQIIKMKRKKKQKIYFWVKA